MAKGILLMDELKLAQHVDLTEDFRNSGETDPLVYIRRLAEELGDTHVLIGAIHVLPHKTTSLRFEAHVDKVARDRMVRGASRGG